MTSIADPASKFFRAMWSIACEGKSVEGDTLQQEMVDAGLAEFRPATLDEAAELEGFVEGDLVLVLTDEGEAALEAGED